MMIVAAVADDADVSPREQQILRAHWAAAQVEQHLLCGGALSGVLPPAVLRRGLPRLRRRSPRATARGGGRDLRRPRERSLC